MLCTNAFFFLSYRPCILRMSTTSTQDIPFCGSGSICKALVGLRHCDGKTAWSRWEISVVFPKDTATKCPIPAPNQQPFDYQPALYQSELRRRTNASAQSCNLNSRNSSNIPTFLVSNSFVCFSHQLKPTVF